MDGENYFVTNPIIFINKETGESKTISSVHLNVKHHNIKESRELTEHELALQKHTADFAGAAMPKALRALDMGGHLLENGYPMLKGYQDMFDDLAIQAYNRQNTALNAMQNIPALNSAAAQSTNSNLSGLSDQYADVANTMAGKQQGLANFMDNEYNTAKGAMTNLYNQLDTATGNVNNQL